MHPTLFRIGPVEIRYYGLMYVIAIVVGIILLRKEIPRKKLPLTKDDIVSYAFWVVIAGILGGRIYYVLFMWKQFYAQNPLEIFAIWHGGLAIHGGILGGALAAFIYSRVKKINFFDLTDAVSPMLALGQAFGRFGNFMNGDAHGLPTNLPWGIVFPRGSVAGDEFPGQPLHPVMLYELAGNVISFFILWKLRKKNHKSGFIFAMYLLNYGIIRFLVSFLRADSLMLGNLRGAQVISLLFIAGALVFIFVFKLWIKEDTVTTEAASSRAKPFKKKKKK
jgi:phosphatidylglycerol:prolipoprotein diacylglycerol transferase